MCTHLCACNCNTAKMVHDHKIFIKAMHIKCLRNKAISNPICN